MPGLFSREEKFDKFKLKTSLKMSTTRINMQKNKKENQLKLQRREIAELLRNGKEDSARIKVEAAIHDAYMIEALELLCLFIDLTGNRLQLIIEARMCPPDMKEAVSTIIWCAPRVENVPELLTIREQLARKFGKEFAHAASDNSEMAVNDKIRVRMSMQVPEPWLCLQTLKDIATQFEIDWEPPPSVAENPGSLHFGTNMMPDPAVPAVDPNTGRMEFTQFPAAAMAPPSCAPGLPMPPAHQPLPPNPPPPIGFDPSAPPPPNQPTFNYGPPGGPPGGPPPADFGADMGGGGAVDFTDLESRLDALKRGN